MASLFISRQFHTTFMEISPYHAEICSLERRLCFHPCMFVCLVGLLRLFVCLFVVFVGLFVCLFVCLYCQQDYAKTYGPIWMKLFGKIGYQNGNNRLDFQMSRSKVKVKVIEKVKNTFLAISRDSVELETSNWAHIVAFSKA